jgi:Uma2 family endonuclease
VTLAPDSHEIADSRIRPLRRVEYDRLARAGSFAGEKVELVYGRLIKMSPQGERHAFSIMRLTKLLARAIDDRADLRIQLPFAASETSEPEPDVAIVPPGDYLEQHPSQALLIIEVAESSLDEDRRIKAPLYAAAGVPELWIVDVAAGAVEVYRDARGQGYTAVTRHGREATLAVPGLPGASVRVGDVVPR